MRTTRRAMIASGLALSILPSAMIAKQAVPDMEPLDTGDVHILSISPDGSTLFGIADRETIVFLDAETLEEISHSEPVIEVRLLDESAVSWSPDSSKVVFGLLAWQQLRDSDLFIATVETGELTNTTAEGHDREADSLIGSDLGPVNVDVYPTWLDASTVIFGRHPFTAEGSNSRCELATLDIESGEIGQWATFASNDLTYVSGPLYPQDDGRILFLATAQDRSIVVAIVDDTGTVEIIDTHDLQPQVVLGSDGADILVADADALNQNVWLLAPDGSEEPVDVRSIFDLETGDGLLSYPRFGPEPGSMVTVIRHDNQVMLISGESITSVGRLSDADAVMNCIWVEGKVLIVGRENAWLIELDTTDV